MFLWGRSIVMHTRTTQKVTESLPISSEVCLYNMLKGNKHWLSEKHWEKSRVI